MVSNDLIQAIRDSDSLIYLKGGLSDSSPWVTLERDYALRSKIDVYCYNQQQGTIRKDTSTPIDFPVYPSYEEADRERVEGLLEFLRHERSFDVFMGPSQGDDFRTIYDTAIFDRLKQGGYVVVFWSDNIAFSDNNLIEHEFKKVLQRYPKQIIIACLDSCFESPFGVPDYMFPREVIQLGRGGDKGIDKHRLDDLIVRLYWLIHRNSRNVLVKYNRIYRGWKTQWRALIDPVSSFLNVHKL